jgi:hypothetical protein
VAFHDLMMGAAKKMAAAGRHDLIGEAGSFLRLCNTRHDVPADSNPVRIMHRESGKEDAPK